MFPSLFPVQNGFDPLAPYPTQGPSPFDAPAPVSPDLMNAGISPVGRPADLSSLSSDDPSNGGIAAAGRDRALAKLQRQSKGEALMSLGAELLGSRTFGEGLSRGIMAYQQTLRANRPTSKPIGDGEYEEVTDPRTGQVTYRTTPIHADKVSDRNKPTIAGNKVYQYGVDASGHYDGTAKDLTPPALEPKTIKDSAGNETIVFVNNDTGEVFDAKGSKLSGPTTAPNAAPGAPGVAPAPPPSDPSRTAAPAPAGGGFDPAIQFVLQHEGSKLNPSDWNGQPVKYGINQKYHPDVANLTEDGAKAIYKSDYWDKSGAASLPAPMQLPFFDTYVRNPSKAQAFLAQSGGDPNKFMSLREAWDQASAQNHPGDANGLANRDRDLRSTMSAPDTTQPYYQGAPTAAAPDAQPQPAAAPDNQWGLQPHNFAPGAPAVRYLSADEKKAAGYPADAVVQRNAKGADTLLDKGTPVGEGPLGPGEEEFYAQAVMAGTPVNQLVPGMGKTAAAQRHQVMSRVAKDAGADGLNGGDFAIQLAHYKGSVANVTNLEKQLGTIKGNEETARLNGEQFIKTSAMIPAQTSSKLLNMPIQTYLRSTGDPNVARMDVAARTFAIEYAKVVQGTPNGGGQVTDSAANEAVKIMAGDYSLKQKIAAYQQSKIDMQNRTQALTGNLQSAYAHMKDRAPELTGSAPHQPAPPQAGTVSKGYRFKGGDPSNPNNWTKI